MSLEGYASVTSAKAGEQVDFHINSSAAANFAVQVAHVAQGNPVMLADNGQAGPQAVAANAAENGVGWPVSFSLNVPVNWPSGIYHANFTAGADQCSVAFVVRPANPGSTSGILLQTCATTEQAYNSWGGASLYPSPGSPNAEQRGRRVSFNRPYDGGVYGREEQFLLWMANNGMTAEVCSGVDLHTGAIPLGSYTLLLSVGHDEYWSDEMRTAVEDFIQGGGNVAFFSGNVCWWQVRFEDNNRTMVCYKSAVEDPLTGQDDAHVTVNWYDAPVVRPENSMTGVGFRNGAGHWTGGNNGAFTVAFEQHWVFDGTGLQNGAVFGNGVVGYEADGALFEAIDGVPVATGRDGTPLDFQVLATADLSGWDQWGQPGMATMGIYQRQGTVFTAATTDWNTGLTDPVCSRITRNVVQRLSSLKPPDLWEQIGHAIKVVAMCGLHWWADMGPSSGRYLFAATQDNHLNRRAPSLFNITWEDIGAANAVIAMAGLDGRLYAITGDGTLWRRPAVPDVGWDDVGAAPANAVALVAVEGQLFAATTSGSLFSSPPPPNLQWQQFGPATNVIAMTAMGGRLLAISADHRLVALSVAQPGAWEEVGAAPGFVAIAALDCKLFGATGDGRLWFRPPPG